MFLLLAQVAFAEPVAIPTEFDTWQLVFVRAVDGAPALDPAAAEALQLEHVGFQLAGIERGVMLAAGPVESASLAGLSVYRAATPEEALAIARTDPAVVAGRFTLEAVPWFTPAGVLTAGGGHRPAEHAAHGGDHATSHHRFDDAERWAAVFDDPARDAWQQPDALIAALDLPKKAVVADIGAGTGYFNERLAGAVGKKGRVIAVDVEPNLVGHMALRALREQTWQVEPRLGGFDDPGLQPDEVDVVLLVDTYHHIDGRIDYFTRLASTIRPGGTLVVVDFKAGEQPVGPPPDHKVPPEQVQAELTSAGYVLSADLDVLPYQFVHVYTAP